MVNIENKVFNDVSTALETSFPGISVFGEHIDASEKFPCVTIMETDSFVAKKYISTSAMENATDVTYEINVYSNKKGGKKTEAKSIANYVDGLMSGYGFMRTVMQQVPNIDRTIYRIMLRYTGRVTATTTTVGQVTTTTFKIYRKD